MKKVILSLLMGLLFMGIGQASHANADFVSDNFNKEHNLWDVTNLSAGTISFGHGAKTFQKNVLGWNSFGAVLKDSRTLQVGDTYELRFSPQSYTEGSPNLCGTCTFYQFGILLDDPTLRASGYGLYVQADGFFAIHYQGVDLGTGQPVVVGETYVLTLEVLANSNLNISLGRHGQEPLLLEFPGPFIGREAWFYQDFYSIDTVDLQDFVGYNKN